MKKTVQLLLVAALALSLSLNGMTALAEDSSATETSSAVTVETKNGETEKKPDVKETEQQESGQKETSSEQTTSETASSSQAAESSKTTANSGTYMDVLWEIDPQAKTLTLTKNTDKVSTNIVTAFYEEFPWYGREKEFSKLIIKGRVEVSGGYKGYFADHITSVEGIYDANARYTFDFKTRTITLQGTGTWPTGWGDEWLAQTVIVGDNIETYDNLVMTEYLEMGAKLKGDIECFRKISKGITVDSQNPYFSSYEGCLYSKDFTTLYVVPETIAAPKFHPALTTLTYGCLFPPDGTTIIIPWGVTTLEDSCIFGTNCTFILPDTVSNVANQFFKTPSVTLTYIVSKNNRAGIKAQVNGGDVSGKITVQVVDSVAQYYPGKVGPEGGETSTVPGPSGEPESSQPSPGPSGGTSQPTTSKPATSQPSTSKPATSQPSTSKPATSQPTSKPATSQPAPSQPVNQPESSVPIESSQPAASSQPESSGESLELSIEPSSEADESTITPVENKATGGWVVPVVVLVIAAAVAAGVVVLRMRKR